ncbi:13056_t:CDS:2 [Acaulospora morrowiae]|uniref:13056_t:CDS:1 n=1 Tax=Acaulospora morrowiae TaxID=94023 RepID=A0A9N9AWU9_9GLOM|nr:13056_t:CDS:2 [Acaulospora morrowiae]
MFNVNFLENLISRESLVEPTVNHPPTKTKVSRVVPTKKNLKITSTVSTKKNLKLTSTVSTKKNLKLTSTVSTKKNPKLTSTVSTKKNLKLTSTVSTKKNLKITSTVSTKKNLKITSTVSTTKKNLKITSTVSTKKMAQITGSIPIITLPTTGTIGSVGISKSKTSPNRSAKSSTETTKRSDSIPTSTSTNGAIPAIEDNKGVTNVNGNTGDKNAITSTSGSQSNTFFTATTMISATTISATTNSATTLSATMLSAATTDTVATASTPTTISTPDNSKDSSKHLPPWVLAITLAILSLTITGLAICIRRKFLKYNRRKPLLGENGQGSMREIRTNGSNGSEMMEDGFNENRSLTNGTTEFLAAGGYEQGMPSHDTTHALVDLTTEDDDPFADAFAEDTSFKNASSHQHSNVMERAKTSELPKIKTTDFSGMSVNGNESPNDPFNIYSDPFQNKEYFLDDEVGPRPKLRPSLSRIPTVITAFSELNHPFPLSPVSRSANVAGDVDKNNKDRSIKDVRNVFESVSSNELSPESASSEISFRSTPLSNNDNLSATDDNADSKSLAEELSTVLSISSAIESTALPIFSTYDNTFEESRRGIVPEFRDDLGVMERSQSPTHYIRNATRQTSYLDLREVVAVRMVVNYIDAV